jgi:hypothetical protein
MSMRLVGLFALLLLALVASGWWWIASTPADEPLADTGQAAITRDTNDATDALPVLRAPDEHRDAGSLVGAASEPRAMDVEPLDLDGGVSAADRVARLNENLATARRSTSSDEQRRLVARLLERFVADVVGSGQSDEVARLVEWHFHRAVLLDESDGDRRLNELADLDLLTVDEAWEAEIDWVRRDDWFAARWITVLAGLGADDVVLANWRKLPADQQAHALLALAWDPLRTGNGLRLDPSDAEDYAAFSRALPLTMGRAVPRAFEPVLLALLDREHEGYRGDRFRDTAAIVLGVMVDQRPDLLAELLDVVRAHPEECQVVMYVLLNAEGAAAKRALMSVRRRPDPTQDAGSDAAHEYERVVRALAYVESRLRAEELADVDALTATLGDPRASGDARLVAAGGVLALVLGNVTSQEQRIVMSDRISAALLEESDLDVAWTELFSLLLLHNQALYRPHTSIGYGSDRTVDELRLDARLSAFSHRLVAGAPSERLLAVMGLFGHAAEADGEPVRDVLRQAMRTEEDATVDRWIRLALRFY